MIFLYIQGLSGDRKQFKIERFEDMKPIFDLFPRTRSIAMKSDSIDDALRRIASYLSSHHLTAWVENNGLQKGLKEKAAAIGLSMATAMTPSIADTPHAQFTPSVPVKVQEMKPQTDFGTDPMDRFLWNVKQIESSGGKNTNHQPIQHGRFKGMIAMGKWGLLKPTVDEIVNRQRLKGNMTPELEKLTSMDRDTMAEHLKQNPQLELNLVRHLATHVLKRQKGDKSKAAYAWLNGHNLFPSDISDEHIANSDYVSKYKRYDAKNPFRQKKPVAAAPIKKQEKTVDTEFSIRFQNWYKHRDDEKTNNPTHDSTWVPDWGRRRDDEADEVTPDSQKTDAQKLKDNVREVNKRR